MSMCCWAISPFCDFCTFGCVIRRWLESKPRFFYIYVCSFVTFLQLLRDTGYRYVVPGSHDFWGAPVDQPAATKFCTEAVTVTYSPNPSCVPNFNLLASRVTKISRGSQIFLDAPLAQTHTNFGPNVCFLVSYSQTQVVYQISSC